MEVSTHGSAMKALEEKVSGIIDRHQDGLSVNQWKFAPIAIELKRLMRLMGRDLINLPVNGQGRVILPLLSFFPERGGQRGSFQATKSGFGISAVVNLDPLFVSEGSPCSIATVLLHNLLHYKQYCENTRTASDSRSYHNEHFQALARDVGIHMDKHGKFAYSSVFPIDPHGRFGAFLECSRFMVKPFIDKGMSFEAHFKDMLAPARKRKPKRLTYECRCPKRIRSTVLNLDALCVRCGTKFKLRDP